MTKPILVTVQQACALLGIKKSKLYQMLAAREIEAHKLGRTQISLASIEAFVERSRVDWPGSPSPRS